MPKVNAQFFSLNSMPKVKTGRRCHFSSTRKCYKRDRHTCTNNVLQSPAPAATAVPLASLEHLNITSIANQLSHWHVVGSKDVIELSLLEGSAPSVVKFSVTIDGSMRWSVRVYGRPVPNYNDLFADFPCTVVSAGTAVAMCEAVEGMCVCDGLRFKVLQ